VSKFIAIVPGLFSRTPDRELGQKDRNKFDFELFWYIFVEVKIK